MQCLVISVYEIKITRVTVENILADVKVAAFECRDLHSIVPLYRSKKKSERKNEERCAA